MRSETQVSWAPWVSGAEPNGAKSQNLAEGQRTGESWGQRVRGPGSQRSLRGKGVAGTAGRGFRLFIIITIGSLVVWILDYLNLYFPVLLMLNSS